MKWKSAVVGSAVLSFACVSYLALLPGQPSHAAELSVPSLAVTQSVLDGENPGIKVSGLRPNEVVRIHALRSLDKWQSDGGQWKRIRQPLHAYADFAASESGSVEVDSATPLKGSYTQPDPLALLRTGYRFGDPALRDVRAFDREPLDTSPEDRVYLKLERAGAVVAEIYFVLKGVADGLVFQEATGPGWHAVYARPSNGTKLLPLITLHGSEGGSVDKAHGRAAQFAAKGFAVLAVNYFTQSYEPISGVPTKHIDIDVALIESAWNWLKARPEVDPTRLGVYGVSKGAEFALLAATQYEWITSVVAVVPSDVVWEGYGEEAGQATRRSSWSIGGKPVPFVPLFSFDPKQEGLYRTSTERYERSRHFYDDRVAAARIPIEKIKARVLLLGSDRDEVWASGEMSRNLAERVAVNNKSGQVEVKIYPKAGHQIAGTGTFPIRLYGEQLLDADAKDIVAEGVAAADAWRRTVRFLRK